MSSNFERYAQVFLEILERKVAENLSGEEEWLMEMRRCFSDEVLLKVAVDTLQARHDALELVFSGFVPRFEQTEKLIVRAKRAILALSE